MEKSDPLPNFAYDPSLKIKESADASHVTEETPAALPLRSTSQVSLMRSLSDTVPPELVLNTIVAFSVAPSFTI